MSMRRNHTVVGPCAPDGDILMATVENRYRGQHHGVPNTPFLLIVQAIDPEGYTWMTRVIGIDKSALVRLDQEAVPFIETDARIESRLHEYFELSWQQRQQCFQDGHNIKLLSNLIQ